MIKRTVNGIEIETCDTEESSDSSQYTFTYLEVAKEDSIVRYRLQITTELKELIEQFLEGINEDN